jgi:hypothetical protein
MVSNDEAIQIILKEEDLEKYEAMQVSQREEVHGLLAVEAGRACNVFDGNSANWDLSSKKVGVVIGGDHERLKMWQEEMAQDVLLHEMMTGGRFADARTDAPDIIHEDKMAIDVEAADVEPMEYLTASEAEALVLLKISQLNAGQHRAYNIIDWHLQETLANCEPPQLLMVMAGEAGIGKSRVIQSITANFEARRVGHNTDAGSRVSHALLPNLFTNNWSNKYRKIRF